MNICEIDFKKLSRKIKALKKNKSISADKKRKMTEGYALDELIKRFESMLDNCPNSVVENINKKRYRKMRNCILSLSATIEFILNWLILLQLNKHMEQFDHETIKMREAVGLILDKLSFREKINVVRLLYADCKIDAGTLEILNNVRDAFAHSLPLTSKKYFIRNKGNIVTNFQAFFHFKCISMKALIDLNDIIFKKHPSILK